MLGLLSKCFEGTSRPRRESLLRADSKHVTGLVRRHTKECGVRLDFLLRFAEALPVDWSSQDVLENAILPETQKHHCRYADVVTDQDSYVGNSTHFVTHNLQAPFQELVTCIRRRFCDEDGELHPSAASVYLWIDIFAVNYHVHGPKLEHGVTELTEVIASVEATLLVLDGRCRVFNRLLALFEMWTTIHLAKESKAKKPKLELLPYCAHPSFIRNEWLRLDVRTSLALRDFDTNTVLHKLMCKGVLRVNRSIRHAIADAAYTAAVDTVSLRTDLMFCLAEEQPDVAAHALHVCGQILQLHGRYTSAQKMYEKAIHLLKECSSMEGQLGPADLLVLQHYTELLLLTKQYGPALAAAQECMQMCAMLGVTDIPFQPASSKSKNAKQLMSQALAHQSLVPVPPGQPEKMGAHNLPGVAVEGVPLGTPDPVSLHAPPEVVCGVLMARAFLGKGDLDKAEHLAKWALDCQAPGLQTWCLQALLQAGKHLCFGKVKPKWSRAAGASRRAGAALPLTALADILHQKGKGPHDSHKPLGVGGSTKAEALSLYFKASKALAGSLGRKHADVAAVQLRMAELLEEQGKLDQAQQMLKGVLEEFKGCWGDNHPETAFVIIRLADVKLAMLGKRNYDFVDAAHQSALQKATRKYMQAFDILKAALGPQHRDTLHTLAVATLLLINSSTTRIQLYKAETMCRIAVKCSVASSGAFAMKAQKPRSGKRQEPSLERLAKGEGGANVIPKEDDFNSSSSSSSSSSEGDSGTSGVSEEDEDEMHEEGQRGDGVGRKNKGPKVPRHEVASLVANLHTLASVLACTGKIREGGIVLAEALAVAEADLPAGHQLVGVVLAGQASVAHASQDFGAAAVAYRKALAIYRGLLSLHVAPTTPTSQPTGSLKSGLTRIGITFHSGLQQLGHSVRRPSHLAPHLSTNKSTPLVPDEFSTDSGLNGPIRMATGARSSMKAGGGGGVSGQASRFADSSRDGPPSSRGRNRLLGKLPSWGGGPGLEDNSGRSSTEEFPDGPFHWSHGTHQSPRGSKDLIRSQLSKDGRSRSLQGTGSTSLHESMNALGMDAHMMEAEAFCGAVAQCQARKRSTSRGASPGESLHGGAQWRSTSRGPSPGGSVHGSAPSLGGSLHGTSQWRSTLKGPSPGGSLHGGGERGSGTKDVVGSDMILGANSNAIFKRTSSKRRSEGGGVRSDSLGRAGSEGLFLGQDGVGGMKGEGDGVVTNPVFSRSRSSRVRGEGGSWYGSNQPPPRTLPKFHSSRYYSEAQQGSFEGDSMRGGRPSLNSSMHGSESGNGVGLRGYDSLPLGGSTHSSIRGGIHKAKSGSMNAGLFGGGSVHAGSAYGSMKGGFFGGSAYAGSAHGSVDSRVHGSQHGGMQGLIAAASVGQGGLKMVSSMPSIAQNDAGYSSPNLHQPHREQQQQQQQQFPFGGEVATMAGLDASQVSVSQVSLSEMTRASPGPNIATPSTSSFAFDDNFDDDDEVPSPPSPPRPPPPSPPPQAPSPQVGHPPSCFSLREAQQAQQGHSPHSSTGGGSDGSTGGAQHAQQAQQGLGAHSSVPIGVGGGSGVVGDAGSLLPCSLGSLLRAESSGSLVRGGNGSVREVPSSASSLVRGKSSGSLMRAGSSGRRASEGTDGVDTPRSTGSLVRGGSGSRKLSDGGLTAQEVEEAQRRSISQRWQDEHDDVLMSLLPFRSARHASGVRGALQLQPQHSVPWRPWQGQQHHHSLHWQRWQQQWRQHQQPQQQQQQQQQQQPQQQQAREDQADKKQVPLLQQLPNRERGRSIEGSVRGSQRIASQLRLPQVPDMSSNTTSPSSPLPCPATGLVHSVSTNFLLPSQHFPSPHMTRSPSQGCHSAFAPRPMPHCNSMPQVQIHPPGRGFGSPPPVLPHSYSGTSSPTSPLLGDLSLPLPGLDSSSNGNALGSDHNVASGAVPAAPYCSSASMRRTPAPISASAPLGQRAFPPALQPADVPRPTDPMPVATPTLPPPPAAMIPPSPSNRTDPLPLTSTHPADAAASAPTTPGAADQEGASGATLAHLQAPPNAPVRPRGSSPFAYATDVAAVAAAAQQATATSTASAVEGGSAFALASPNPSCPAGAPSKPPEAVRARFHRKSHSLALGGIPTPGGTTRRTLSHGQASGGWGSKVFNRWGFKRLRKKSERRASSKLAQMPSSREVLKNQLTVEVEPADHTLLGPYQAILQIRQKDGPGKTRPLMCIEHETATVLNNLAVLLRWNQGATEAETLLNQALRLLDPPPLANAWHGHGRASTRASAELKLTKSGNPNSAVDAATPLVSPNASKANMSHFDRPSIPGSMAAEGSDGWAGAARNSAALGLLPMSLDPRIAHLKAMVLSNLGGLLGSQGRYLEAVTSYREALRMCESFNRPVDEMIIAMNLISVYRRLNMMQPALSLAQASVEPVLGVTFGVHNRRARARAQSCSAHEPAPAQWGYDPTNPYNHPFGKGYGPHPGGDNSAGRGHWDATDPMADYKTQLLEALATCVADDGAAPLYLWAGQQLAKRKLAAARSARAHSPGATPEGHETLLPETLFLLQIPGVHLQCIHMLRWLLVVPAEQHLGCAVPNPKAGQSSMPLPMAAPIGQWPEADTNTDSDPMSSLFERLSGRPRTSAPLKLPSQRF